MIPVAAALFVLAQAGTTQPAPRDSVRRIPVTPQLLSTAFKTDGARLLVQRARVARFAQDSALESYVATAYQRVTVGLAFRENARGRVLIRDEEATHITWQRGVGALVEMKGKRTAVAGSADANASIDPPLGSSLPIPYFPGRDAVWIGGSLAKLEIDDADLVHPLAQGSEAYYTFAIGDSLQYTLPSARDVRLIELRITPRAPQWNLIVGSFWFDEATTHLVRAAYRMAVPMDVLQITADEHARDPSSDDVPWWAKSFISPVRAEIQLLTTEYALFENRFWLPVRQAVEARGQLSLVRVPFLLEDRYEYSSVNGAVSVEPTMTAAPAATRVASAREIRDSITATGGHPTSAVVDSIVAARETAAGDSAGAERRRTCRDPRSEYVRRTTMYDGRLNVVVRIPCDQLSLADSPELPPPSIDLGGTVFSEQERSEAVNALGFNVQAGWQPQPVSFEWGFGQSRYNRIEGFSTGIALHEELGLGYSWSAQLRGGQGDRQANGALSIARSNGRSSYAFTAYRRLASVSDWGQPLSFSASIPGLFSGRYDEGFYYRAWGAEVTQHAEDFEHLSWRAFVEDQWNAPVTTRFSIAGGRNDRGFADNVRALSGTFVGASARWREQWGAASRGWQAFLDTRVEGAAGATRYARGAVELTLTHRLFEPIAASLTTAAGTSAGALPPQRRWFLGGAQTVRGQDPGAATGTAFWLTRAELAFDRPGAARLAGFADFGWAGSRNGTWGGSARPMSDVGVGTSFLDGLFRLDIAYGIWPREQRRTEITTESRY